MGGDEPLRAESKGAVCGMGNDLLCFVRFLGIL